MGDSDKNDLLRDLVSLIHSGKPLPSASISTINEALTHWQAKIDLVQVGLTIHQTSRLASLASSISGLEDGLLQLLEAPGVDGIPAMDVADRISLLKILNKDFRDTAQFVSDRSIKPTISSSETMRRIPENSLDDDAQPRLPAESREKVRALIGRIMNRATVIDAQVIDEKPKKPKRRPRKKPRKV